MADIYTPTPEQLAEWEEWCDERPPKVAEVARRLPPWKLYWLSDPGQRVLVTQYDEMQDGSVTVRVDVLGTYNFVTFDRNVFGVDPANLEECDLPTPDEIVGTVFIGDEADVFIDKVARPAIFGPKKAEEIRQQIENERA